MSRSNVIAALLLALAVIGGSFVVAARTPLPSGNGGAGTGQASPIVPKANAVLRGLSYGSDPAQRLDVYYPASLGVWPKAMVLYVPEGGWANNGRRLGRVGRELLDAGFILTTMDYRSPQTHPFPAQYEDVRSAVAFVRSRAASLHVDASRVGALGWGQSGYLVTLAGVAEGSERSHGEPRSLAAVVDLGGPTDLRPLFAPGGDPALSAEYRRLFGGRRPPDAVLASSSPVAHASAGNPPLLLVEDSDTTDALGGQLRRMRESLEASRSPAALARVPSFTPTDRVEAAILTETVRRFLIKALTVGVPR